MRLPTHIAIRLALLGAALSLALAACQTVKPTPTPTPIPAPTRPAPAPTPTPIPDAGPTPTARPTPTPVIGLPFPPDLLERLKVTEERIVNMRGLQPAGEPKRKLLTKDSLAEKLRQRFESEDAKEMQTVQEVLIALGLLSPGTDLAALQLKQLGDEILGLFDTKTGDLYIVTSGKAFSQLEEMTHAHEFVHALQQDHFDIHTKGDALEDDSEASAALTALIEGDATLAGQLYAQAFLDPRKINEEARAIISTIDRASIPFVLEQSLNFPYTDGLLFAVYLYRTGGWKAINDAYADPPKTTEQILHPEKYTSREPALAVTLPGGLAERLGAGWVLADTDYMGELSYRILLDAHLSRADANRGAEGWGGDRLAYFRGPSGEKAIAIPTRWDTQNDAKEFFDLYAKSFEAQKGQAQKTPTTIAGAAGGRYHYLRITGDRTLLIIADEASQAERLAGGF